MRTNISSRFQRALRETVSRLKPARFLCGRPVSVKAGLRGWVFEQVVRSLLEKELKDAGLDFEVLEQQSLGGRSRVDLLIGCVAVELKSSGLYSDETEKYTIYRERAEAKGWYYFYVSLEEAYQPRVEAMKQVFGRKRAYFLDREGEWDDFVTQVVTILKKKGIKSESK